MKRFVVEAVVAVMAVVEAYGKVEAARVLVAVKMFEKMLLYAVRPLVKRPFPWTASVVPGLVVPMPKFPV